MEKVIVVISDDEDEMTEAHVEKEKVAIVTGDCVGVSVEGFHYKGFHCNGNNIELGDSVLVIVNVREKPYVGIIKDVTKEVDNSVMVNVQWFYRPEKTERKGGGCWKSQNTHEVFYTTHCDNVKAESVLHKCVVHFVPLNKELPVRSKHPGLIVRRVYDAVEKKLWDMTHYKGDGDGAQIEIDSLIQKTRERLGGFVDLLPT
ncbi:hypothetical protein ZOSMA_75G00590 [Zostera marina]|uniref:BAH domain-containing protein n=1 Tax=Zostera marina TaxID=29655 RepID=A0A0K9NPG2_ZOSMR|nr:hypothetical protein ZOSMA_75G00590 [Zostera marina]